MKNFRPFSICFCFVVSRDVFVIDYFVSCIVFFIDYFTNVLQYFTKYKIRIKGKICQPI